MDIVTTPFFHGNVSSQCWCEYEGITHTSQYYSTWCLHTILIHVENTEYQNCVGHISNFQPFGTLICERERIHMYNSALIHCQIALSWTMRISARVHSVLICVSLHGWGECCLIMTARRAGKIVLFPLSRKVDLMHFNCSHIYTP